MTARRSRDGTLSSALLLAANILIPVAIFVFGTGFFPYKPLLSGLASYDAVTEYGEPPAAPFDKLVFVVIDALRRLIRNGAAIPFTAHATSPTVTMPRLKAITTGSIPSFLDVVLNLDEGDESSSLASQDTWLAQMKAKGTGKLVMYGDDTWLKLFPGTFDRAEGTTSFFVSDFTEVDNNVTRHVADELKSEDWNTLVLHYLGLDHIGHKGGPKSPHMVVKQREMDGIVRQIYTAIESEDHLRSTLFVVCGDHGMNDAGNHGASSPGETSPALVFMSPKLKALNTRLESPLPETESFQYYSTVEQSDLAPTLAALLGFPVPKNNLGALIPEFLPFWPEKQDQVQLLMRNARQILDIVIAAFGQQILDSDTNAATESDYEALAHGWKDLADSYAKSAHGEDRSRLIQSITKAGLRNPGRQWRKTNQYQWLQNAQSVLSSMASNYDMPRLFLGQAAAVAALVAAVIAAARCANDRAASFIPISGILVAYGVMMFASSYVEEEHHFWYWATTAWFAFLGVRGYKRGHASAAFQPFSTTALLLATRIIRSWNQTGQKFAGEPDIVKTFLNTSPTLLWCLIGATYFWVHQNLIYGLSGLPVWLSFTTATGLVLAAFTFKVSFTLEDAPELVTEFARSLLKLNFTHDASLVARARAVFIGLGLLTALTVAFILARRRISLGQSGPTTLHPLLTLLLLTQTRPASIPLYLLSALPLRLLFVSLADLSPVEISTTVALLQHAAFFAAGGSNSIASVDLSSAYNGVASFHPATVGLLTFVGNWGPSLWWSLGGVLLLLRKREMMDDGKGGGARLWKGHVAVLTVFAAGSVVGVMAACTVLRTHLFVWTVFSPKYLYCVAWSVGQHLVVDVVVGGAVYWLGVWEQS
ncbi:hypothetical protein NEMBOFW57_000297 [Staphylotrichum longicolle]|uniref:GPI ethanolamine phosphate transferase 2 n=1 Tax=Staphylotrichum longicolle TaxID=669026 RepID=A0AAD4I2T2_9PEZI|nr:hypothetical protein NEMBOFW57_000297 [Staphylotrichum longicolle]